jgi:hypothetical protein
MLRRRILYVYPGFGPCLKPLWLVGRVFALSSLRLALLRICIVGLAAFLQLCRIRKGLVSTSDTYYLTPVPPWLHGTSIGICNIDIAGLGRLLATKAAAVRGSLDAREYLEY